VQVSGGRDLALSIGPNLVVFIEDRDGIHSPNFVFKSCSITFTLRKSSTPDVTINDIQIPLNTEIKYLGMNIDRTLTWKQHIVKKRKQINITIKQLNWVLGRKSNLAIENKLLIYKTIIIHI
jgi:hypothetical protein